MIAATCDNFPTNQKVVGSNPAGLTNENRLKSTLSGGFLFAEKYAHGA